MNKDEKDTECSTAQCKPLDKNYWNERWEKGETGWDMRKASPAIVEYMQQYTNKEAAILIPGCGNAYEAEFLLASGFRNITLIDIAPKAVQLLKEKFFGKTGVNVLCEDFFQHQGRYDLMIEQTFFCAIAPVRRKEYAQKVASLLNPNGKIVGVLFDRQFHQPFPPFGGSPCQYKLIFEPYFTIRTMDQCYNSILPRAKSEVFINFVKK